MIHNFLAIDLGASSGRAVLGRLEDERVTFSEVHRFPNGPIHVNGSLRWDVVALEREIRLGVQRAVERVDRLDGLGLDSWGVDYVLLNAAAPGQPIEPPFHYRDSRTAGAMDRVFKKISRSDLYARTGIQFLPFNTIYQLASEDKERLASADGLLLIADYFAHRLGARPVGEMTLASTSQLLDARTRGWATDLAGQLGIPADLLPELVEAGQVIGQTDDGTPIIATASHDTGAAVVGCPAAGPGDWAFLSSGTWSILGMELDQPRLGPDALAAGMSNEAGVAGTIRLLRNIMGLWLLQESRRQWAAAGKDQTWDELVRLAGDAKPFSAVLDPDDETFLAPGDMPARIAEFCRRTNQPAPDSVGQFVRVIFESLALKTRWVLDRLESVAGRRAHTIHLVGGGASNRLLCQWTADATSRVVLAGPAEATAAGNVLTQAVGVGAISSFAYARQVLRQSIELDEYEPLPSAEWDGAYERLRSLLQA